MRLRLRPSIATVLLFGSGGFDSYVTNTIVPLVYYKFNESSGNLIDYGSEGANGAVTGAVQGVTGIAGLGAYTFDGVDDLITVTNADIPNLKALTTQRWAALIHADSLGEGNNGTIYYYGGFYSFKLVALNRLQMLIDTDGTDASSLSSNGEISNIVGADTWIFADYDDADDLGGGRVVRLFKGLSGTVTELAYGAQTPATGSVVAPTNNLILGNSSDTSRTFDGEIYAIIAGSGLWTTAIMQKLVDLTGV